MTLFDHHLVPIASEADAEQTVTALEPCLDEVERGTADTSAVYGTSVVKTLFQTAESVGATAIAFQPRGGSRIARLLTGNPATRLVTEPELPVVPLPNPGVAGVQDNRDDAGDGA